MAIATLHSTILQVRKVTNIHKESLLYHVRIFPAQKAMKEFTFEYSYGEFKLSEGDAGDREKELMIHGIQALELSNAFI